MCLARACEFCPGAQPWSAQCTPVIFLLLLLLLLLKEMAASTALCAIAAALACSFSRCCNHRRFDATLDLRLDSRCKWNQNSEANILHDVVPPSCWTAHRTNCGVAELIRSQEYTQGLRMGLVRHKTIGNAENGILNAPQEPNEYYLFVERKWIPAIPNKKSSAKRIHDNRLKQNSKPSQRIVTKIPGREAI